MGSIKHDFFTWYNQGLSSGFLSQFAGVEYSNIDKLRSSLSSHKEEMLNSFGTFGDFSDFIKDVAIKDCGYDVFKDVYGIYHRED